MPVAHLKALAFALLVLLVCFAQQRYEVRMVPEDAVLMQPALRPRATRVFNTDGIVPPRGAVVWFEHARLPGRMLVARAVGVPGDRIALEGGRAVRNGKALPEDYAERRIQAEDLAEIVVPDGHIYVLNDVRGDAGSPACDSRRLGPIPVPLCAGWLADRVADREAAREADKGGAR